MKKLKLRALSLGAKEILSREQLKSITGGCTSDSDCPGAGNFCDTIVGNCTASGEAAGSGMGSGSGGGHGSDSYEWCPPVTVNGHPICTRASFSPQTGAFVGCVPCESWVY